MKLVLISLLMIMLGFNNKPIDRTDKFDCILTSDKSVYKAGQIPKFEVRIINKSKEEVYLPGSLDGSEEQWRLPYCYFSIQKPIPDTLVFPRCGNTNPLRLQDFKLLKPGEAIDPYGKVDNYGFFSNHMAKQKETFKNAGRYTIQFHYSTIADTTKRSRRGFSESYRKADSTEIKRLLKQVPAINISSNALEIKFEE